MDSNKHFAKVASQFLKNKKNIKVINKDILKLNQKKKIIICLGTITIFDNPIILIKKIINLMLPNSIAIIDGIFNDYDCDVKIKYRDRSQDSSLKKWHSNINIHSKKTIKDFLQKQKNIKFNFLDYKIDTVIKKNNKKPHINWWTEKDNLNDLYLTNGLMIKKNNNFLVIKN